MRVKDVTLRGAAERNYQVSWTQKVFESHLRDSGYIAKSAGNGKVTNWFHKDGSKSFTTRSFSSSTDGPSAEMHIQGEVAAKIRFEKEK